ncbi:MAG: hypothetical protein HDS57_05460 [Barnesiella sp.]|nr:hypothetical protein [Barnesiella sp.]
MSRKSMTYIGMAVVAAASAMLTSCFTGIESTPKITASDVRRENIKETPEQRFTSDISGEPPGEWKPGKLFYVTDNRLTTLMGPGADRSGSLRGSRISFAGFSPEISITGDSVTDINFSDGKGNTLRYRADVSPEALRGKNSFEIPFTIEESVIDEVGRRMKGNTYYVMTSMWYDAADQSMTGLKYVPVTVEKVMEGNTVYPVKLILRTEDGHLFRLFMSVGSNLKAPRGFASLFSMTDPKLRYPSITDANWQNIIHGRLAEGMTRDECRLSLGSPARISRRNDRSYMYEMWHYENGVYLVFQDGLLTNFRR